VGADERGLDDAVERDTIDDIGAGTADANDADARPCFTGTFAGLGTVVFYHNRGWLRMCWLVFKE
jgi:hypothetical protein